MNSALILGGYGTFGSIIAKELAANGIDTTIAGRNLQRAQALAESLGPTHRAAHADVREARSCLEALKGHEIAVNCAGPFHTLGPTLLDACLDAGCHYTDIADDRTYCNLVRSYDDRFRQRNRAAVYGCSSLPAISGALALYAHQNTLLSPFAHAGERGRGEGASLTTHHSPITARVTLFIGNNNPKGAAAIHSLVKTLGKPIHAPQGIIHGFQGRELITLPHPIGKRAAFNFDSPEYDLFPGLLGVHHVTVKVAFDLRLATYSLAALAMFGSDYGEGTARLLERLGRLTRTGTSAGAVMTELFYPDGSKRSAVIHARQDGQRMAALPCALAVQHLLQFPAAGAMTAYELLGPDVLLQQLQKAGFELSPLPSRHDK